MGATVRKSPRMSASSRSPVPRSRKMMFRYGKSIRKRTSRNLASLPIAKSSNSSNSRSDVAGTAACSLRTLRTFHMCCADYQGYRPRAVVASNVSPVRVCPWALAEGGVPPWPLPETLLLLRVVHPAPPSFGMLLRRGMTPPHQYVLRGRPRCNPIAAEIQLGPD